MNAIRVLDTDRGKLIPGQPNTGPGANHLTEGSSRARGSARGQLTPQKVEAVGVEQLEAEQCEDDLHREGAAVHKVAVEKLQPELSATSTTSQPPFSERPAFSATIITSEEVHATYCAPVLSRFEFS